jgi:hypothetical protein
MFSKVRGNPDNTSSPATSSEHSNPLPISNPVPYQVVHCFIVPQAHTHRLFDNPKSTPVWFSRQMKQIFCPPFDPQTKAEETPGSIEWATQPVPTNLQRPTFSKTDLAKPWKCTGGSDLSKQYHLMPHIMPVRPHPSSNIHPPIGHYIFNKPVDESEAIYSWTTEP